MKVARHKSMQYQNGTALLGLVLVLVVAFSTVLLATMNAQSHVGKAGVDNAKVFETAKQALLGYALSYPEVTGDAGQVPGRLPCPDRDGDGDADSPCDNQDETSIGRLPWRTLGISPLRDHTGECLWYAVSGTFKQDVVAVPSSETNGLLVVENAGGNQLVGGSDIDRAVAVLFSAGNIVDNQNRGAPPANRTECGASGNPPVNRVANFLDMLGDVNNALGTKAGVAAGSPGSNAIPTSTPSLFAVASGFLQSGPSTFNDSLVWIGANHYQPVFQRMNQWVASKVQQCLLSYGANNVLPGGGGGASVERYPWAAMLDASAAIDYVDDSDQRFGRIPDNLGDTVLSNAAMDAGWPIDPLDPGETCFNWSWWPQWQSQVFYAIHDDNAPVTAGSGNLLANGSAAQFIVLVAGRQFGVQARATDSEMGSIENYLESDNIPATGNGAIPGGDESFVSSTIVTFNDVLCDSSQCYF